MTIQAKRYIADFEELMQEWNWEANAELDPSKLTVGSNKKAWWRCSLCGYRWETSISHRAKDGRCCPNCHHGRWLKNKDSLAKIKPQSVKDWHPTKNSNLTPYIFAKGARYKAWWKCHECGREWQQEIKSYNGCIVCNKKHRLEKNSLAKKFPKVATEWHPTKNGSLTPNDVFCSNKKVWWKCNKCGYEWQARIDNRVHNRGCPCCSNKVVVKGINDLATTYPELVKEWHPTKNGDLTPQKISFGYGKKVWWLCPHGHEYQATPNKRTNGTGTNCPICYSGRQTSFAEQAFYFYIKKMYPDAINRYKADFLGKMELDIYIPSIKLAIEYDGIAWHKETKLAREQKKYQICKSQGIYLIRLKEKKGDYKGIADDCYCIPDLYKSNKLNHVIPHILEGIDPDKTKRVMERAQNLWCQIPVIPTYDVDVERDKIEILKIFATEHNNDSFGALYPELAKEWHPSKNEGLTPFMFKPYSGHKVWWKCSVCGHEYETTIGHRTYGYGCIKCGIEKSTQVKRKAVEMIDPETNKVIQTFISISDASRKMKISSGNIAMVCKGIRPKASGYIWRYADEEEATKYQKNKNQLEFNF